ncbi:MAG TPA: hypothetical protein VN253_10185 [Kofleriaceae bacterium]|nr:hypothetical protein [Kofleriaceae bacterium]
MKTRADLEAALTDLGWQVIGPTRTAGGWKATIQRGSVSMLVAGSTEIDVLEDLLRSAEARARRQS